MRLAASVSCQRSSESSQSGTSSSGQTPATAAQTSSPPSCLAGLGEEPVGVVLPPQVGLEQHRALAVGRDRLGPLPPLVEVQRRRGSPRLRTRVRRQRRSRRTPRSRARACLPAPSPPRVKCFHLGRENSTGSCRRVARGVSERSRAAARPTGIGRDTVGRAVARPGRSYERRHSRRLRSSTRESAPKRTARGPTSRRKRRMRAISIPSASARWSISTSQVMIHFDYAI